MTLMKKAAFAELCGVSQPMVSKYVRDGKLSLRNGKVDAEKSLAMLEGRLDEEKRRAALEKLNAKPARAPAAAVEEANGVEDETPPAPVDEKKESDEPLGWKARRDAAQAKQAELDFEERLGNTLDVAEVRTAIEDLISTFWSEAERRQRADAEDIAAALKLNPEQAALLRRKLRERTKALQSDFAAALRNALEGGAAGRADAA